MPHNHKARTAATTRIAAALPRRVSSCAGTFDGGASLPIARRCATGVGAGDKKKRSYVTPQARILVILGSYWDLSNMAVSVVVSKINAKENAF